MTTAFGSPPTKVPMQGKPENPSPAQEIEKTKKELYSIISEHSGQPLEKIYADGDRDFWMTSQEALEYGMIDEILTRKK